MPAGAASLPRDGQPALTYLLGWEPAVQNHVEKGTHPSQRLQVQVMGQGEQHHLRASPRWGQTFIPAQLGGHTGGARSCWRNGSGKPFLLSSSRKFIFHVLLLLCPRSSFSWWCVGVCEGFILSPLNHCSTTSFQPFCTAKKSLMAFLLIFLLKETASELHSTTWLHPSSRLGSSTPLPSPSRSLARGAPPACWHPRTAAQPACGQHEGARDASALSAPCPREGAEKDALSPLCSPHPLRSPDPSQSLTKSPLGQ